MRDSEPNVPTFRRGRHLAAGAEGDVYECASQPEWVAKVFKGTAQEIAAKGRRVREMLKLDELKRFDRVTWPLHALICRGTLRGYVMRRITGAITLVPLAAEVLRRRYLPGWTLRHRVRVAHDISAIGDFLEKKSIYIVDTSLANFLTAPADGKTYLIDTDSLQFTSPSEHFSSSVYTPDFAAPEILRNPRLIQRIGPEQARFTIALILFQVLVQGSPFQVKDSANLEPAQQILAGRTFLGGRGRATGATSRELFERYRALPPYVAHLFIRAFWHGHNAPGERPTFAEWTRACARYYGELRSDVR